MTYKVWSPFNPTHPFEGTSENRLLRKSLQQTNPSLNCEFFTQSYARKTRPHKSMQQRTLHCTLVILALHIYCMQHMPILNMNQFHVITTCLTHRHTNSILGISPINNIRPFGKIASQWYESYKYRSVLNPTHAFGDIVEIWLAERSLQVYNRHHITSVQWASAISQACSWYDAASAAVQCAYIYHILTNSAVRSIQSTHSRVSPKIDCVTCICNKHIIHTRFLHALSLKRRCHWCMHMMHHPIIPTRTQCLQVLKCAQASPCIRGYNWNLIGVQTTAQK